MISKFKRRQTRLVLGAFLGLTITATSHAQDPQPSDQEQQQTRETGRVEPTQPADHPGPILPMPQGPVDMDIHPAGKAIPWLGSSSPLRWGSFSIGNFTYDHINDHFQPVGNVPSANLELSIMRTSIVFDRLFWKQRLVLQYEPQLAVLNGKFAGNAGMDNVLVLGTTFAVTPRLTIVVKDAFADVHSRQLYPQNFLAVDQQAGNLIQNNFLQNAGSYLTNEATGIISYLITPRTTLTVAPAYKYIHATNDQQVLYVAKGNIFSDTVALTHALTERQSLGVTYALEYLRQDNAAGVPVNTYFHTVGLYYANRLAQSWWFRSEIGANFARYPDNIPPVDTVAGSLSIVKTFTQASVALGYSRGRIQDNFVTNHIGDLAQASYTQHLGKRLAWNSGAGYYRETGAEPRNQGNLPASGLDLEIHPNLFIVASYTHTFQKSSTPQLLSGIRNTFIVGMKWEPRPAVH